MKALIFTQTLTKFKWLQILASCIPERCISSYRWGTKPRATGWDFYFWQFIETPLSPSLVDMAARVNPNQMTSTWGHQLSPTAVLRENGSFLQELDRSSFIDENFIHGSLSKHKRLSTPERKSCRNEPVLQEIPLTKELFNTKSVLGKYFVQSRSTFSSTVAWIQLHE